jgi:hypothetical protein
MKVKPFMIVLSGGSHKEYRARYIDFCQRFCGLASEFPQTGQAFSVGLTMRLALHLGHLTLWSFIRLTSMG